MRTSIRAVATLMVCAGTTFVHAGCAGAFCIGCEGHLAVEGYVLQPLPSETGSLWSMALRQRQSGDAVQVGDRVLGEHGRTTWRVHSVIETDAAQKAGVAAL